MKIVYSPEYRRKISELKKYLDIQFGVSVRKKVLRQITERIHTLRDYPYSGISMRDLYDIDTDYCYIFVGHNYVFYRRDSENIYVVNMYNEREDYMMSLFGIKTGSGSKNNTDEI